MSTLKIEHILIIEFLKLVLKYTQVKKPIELDEAYLIKYNFLACPRSSAIEDFMQASMAELGAAYQPRTTVRNRINTMQHTEGLKLLVTQAIKSEQFQEYLKTEKKLLNEELRIIKHRLRALEKTIEENKDRRFETKKNLTCFLTERVMYDPVIIETGYTFERKAIEDRLKTNPTCPKSYKTVDPRTIIPNNAIKGQCDLYWQPLDTCDEIDGQIDEIETRLKCFKSLEQFTLGNEHKTRIKLEF